MITRYLTIILLAVTTASFGQARDSAAVKFQAPHHVIKFSPLHLINFYPTIELSYEYRLANYVSVQLEGGYVLDYESNINKDYQNKRGFKAKLEPRYYLGFSTKRAASYLSTEFYLNRINFDRETTSEGCIDQLCNFRFMQTSSYEMKYRERGATVKMGFVFQANRFIVDLNSGWTIRMVRYDGHRSNGWGDDVFDGVDFEPNETDRISIGPNLGIRFGYRLE